MIVPGNERELIERIVVVLLACLTDALVGDPRGWWHPVIGIGWLISGGERILWRVFSLSPEPEEMRGRKRLAGGILAAAVIAISCAVPTLLVLLAGRAGRAAAVLLSGVLGGWMLAQHSLIAECMRVGRALEAGDIEEARAQVSMIVGRDTEELTAAGITRAAVETAAENTSDGVTGPLLALMVFGIPGIFFYKAVSTMDSMVGYRNDRYRYFGTAGARLDDLLNLLVSRLSALLMVLAAFLIGEDGRGAWRIWRRDRQKHKSPNSAQTESVCAGALDLQLAGDASYFGAPVHKPTLGDPIREPQASDVRRACALSLGTSLLLLFLWLILSLAVLALAG